MQTVVPTQCAYYLYLSRTQKLKHRIIIILRNQTTSNNFVFFFFHCTSTGFILPACASYIR